MTHPHNPPAAALGSHQQENAAAPAPVDADHPSASTGATRPTSIDLLLAMRARQIEKFGHTPEADMARPLADLVAVMAPYMRYLREDISCHAPLDAMEKHAAALGAMTLALLDRIHGERETRHG